MKTALPDAINSIAEAQQFLTALYNNGESFHPEDDANGVIWYLPKQTKPTREEANQLNKLMNDIYALPGNDGRHSEPLAFDPCGWLLKLDSYNFLIKDRWSKEEADDIISQSMGNEPKQVLGHSPRRQVGKENYRRKSK